jgi:DNA-binding NtrC family response regulator
VLLVDDEEDILFSAATVLRNVIPNTVLTTSDSSQVLPLLAREEMALVVLDLHMPGITGQELLPKITYEYPHLPVLIMTASNTIETAVECMRYGAFDYLLKPVEKSRLTTSVLRALEVYQLKREVSSLKQCLLTGTLNRKEAFVPILTRSSKMLALFQYLDAVAESDQPVLISGETGVGKELVARSIHDASGRKGQFVAVNLAGLDDQMFSDSLFGHRKGAFTGADQAREGLVAAAAGGTLFLDEIGDLNAGSQVKLLRLLQEGEYYPLGSDVAKRSSARIIAATNCDLQGLIQDGGFRKDLYYRLCAHSCFIPPLRERIEDLPLLLDHFLESAATKLHRKKPDCPEALVSYLSSYSFPGNIRELQAMVHDAVARQKSTTLSLAHFSDKIGTSGPRNEAVTQLPRAEVAKEQQVVFSRFPSLKEAEEELISRALEMAKGNQGVAAALLGVTRQALNNRLTRKQRKS